MAPQKTGHRKSSLLLTARFPVVKWRYRSVAKSAYWGSVREWQKSRLVSLCASLRESSPSCVSSRVPLTRDFSQYPPNGELTRRQAPRAPLTLNSLLVRQNRKLSRINTTVHLYITIFYHLPKISLFLKSPFQNWSVLDKSILHWNLSLTSYWQNKKLPLIF